MSRAVSGDGVTSAAQEGLFDAGAIRMYAVSRGTGRVVVFIHGLGWDHTLWSSAVPALATRYRAVAGDTRGHGKSDKPPGPYTVDGFADDWRGLLDTLGAERVCLVGFSLGGMIAMRFALDHPARVEALVLASTLCRADAGLEEKLETRIRAAREEGPLAAARVGAKQIFSPRFMSERPERVESFVEWRAAMTQEPLFDAARASFGFDLSGRLGELRMPVLVMYAHDDVITPPAMNRGIVDAVAHAEVVRFPDPGHMIPVERPAAFEATLVSFLDRRYPPRGC